MEPLSRRQKDVLQIIEEYLTKQGFPPSIREIANRLGLSGTVSVVQHLNALERKGYIKRSRSSSRGITVTAEGAGWKQELLPGVDWGDCAVRLPVVSQVRPGMLEPAEEEIIDQISLDQFARLSGTQFVLRMRGDSMRGAGIMDGDLVLVRPHQDDTSSNDIVVCLLNNELLVRRCLHEQGFIRLQPEHPAFDPLFVRLSTPGFHIIGTVTAVFRMLQSIQTPVAA